MQGNGVLKAVRISQEESPLGEERRRALPGQEAPAHGAPRGSTCSSGSFLGSGGSLYLGCWLSCPPSLFAAFFLGCSREQVQEPRRLSPPVLGLSGSCALQADGDSERPASRGVAASSSPYFLVSVPGS